MHNIQVDSRCKDGVCWKVFGNVIQGTGSNTVLRQVTVPIIDQTTCASRQYYGRYMDTITMICAGYEQGGKDSCQVSLPGNHVV